MMKSDISNAEALNPAAESHGTSAQFGSKISRNKENFVFVEKTTFGNIQQKLKSLQQQLDDLQQPGQTLDNTDKVVELEKEINEWHIEEEFYKQKSRDKSFHEANQNTKYLHVQANKRRARNRIESLQRPNGSWCSGRDNLENMLTNHFQTIMSTTDPTQDNDLLNILPECITEEDNTSLVKVPYIDEIEASLKNMHPWKAPGPDGFPPGFFQSQWEVVKHDVIKMASYVPGRQISDNMLMAQELIHCMKRKKTKKKGYMALKLDMSKAFDRVKWTFLNNVMRKLLTANGVNWLKTQKKLQGIKISRNAPQVTHFIFADGCLLFEKADMQNVNTLLYVINNFSNISGQQEKNHFFFWIGRQDEWKIIKMEWQVHKSGGQMVKSVLSTTSSHHMSVFKVPDETIKEIDKVQRKFWWGIKDGKGYHFISWTAVGKDQVMGGLGFRDLSCFNQALLARTAWRLYNQNDQLCKVFIWHDVSIPGKSSPPTSTIPTEEAHNYKYVSELIDQDTRSWKQQLVQQLFNQEDATIILKIRIPMIKEDRLIWTLTRDGHFTVKSAYKKLVVIKQNGSMVYNTAEAKFWKQLWSLDTLPKVEHLLWKCLTDILPSNKIMARVTVYGGGICKTCNQRVETTRHILTECIFSRAVWLTVPDATYSIQNNGNSVANWIRSWFSDGMKDLVDDWIIRMANTAWEIWKARCNNTFQDISNLTQLE
ncbi:uncharacterized protein LOC113271808 [Papaver somniferum]|uniref:uncharacterized protein LOC113271808 n=1 Tax=Papaver somniferum TaxID=3469 RepID=UPI000E6F8899|nr:uncharacterized protein LOC113271808 [Papaver somniferum]